MVSILKEIERLRAGRSINVDHTNTNRYAVITDEQDGSKTAYYFSAPIYNTHTRKAVSLMFEPRDNGVRLTGSNACITVSDSVRIENSDGYCVLQLGDRLTGISEDKLSYGSDILLPTINGIAYKASCKDGASVRFEIEVGKPFVQVRANDKCFALMSDRFRPFVVVSCIGTMNAGGEVIAPAAISYQRLSDYRYRLTVTPCSPFGEWVMFECNVHEPKLLQDTTVESRNPQMNNAFGGTAFIGSTAQYGEQWLYSKPDFARFPELINKRIGRAILHLPKHNRSNVELRAFKVAARFCSFGSNWNNKIASGDAISDTAVNSHYQDLDITSLLAHPNAGHITHSDGWILKPRIKDGGFSVIGTGDSSYAPQIIEINYK